MGLKDELYEELWLQGEYDFQAGRLKEKLEGAPGSLQGRLGQPSRLEAVKLWEEGSY